MKKKKLNVKSLSLNKKTISNLNSNSINGGKRPITQSPLNCGDSDYVCDTSLAAACIPVSNEYTNC